MKRALLLVALVAACGDDHPKMQADAGGDAAPMPDAPIPEPTLTSYVIDLVQHHTSDTEAPRPASEFSSLPDPDMNNGSAYAPLF